MNRDRWVNKKLGEVCQILNGFAFKSENYVDEGIRVMRITNVQKGEIVDDAPKYYPLTEMTKISQFLLSENDLLMSLTGNVGRVGLLQKEMLPAALNQRVACIRIKDNNLLLKYLFYKLNSNEFEHECIFNATGIAQKNMSTEWLKKVSIPLPPKDIQQRIVEELDAISDSISMFQQQMNDLDSLAQSIFYDMFGDPIENPRHWDVKKVGDLASEIKYGTSSPACENGQYKYLRMCNITYNGYLDLSDMKKINISEAEIEKYIVRKGDILFNRTNSVDLIGKTCMFDEDEPMVIAGYIIKKKKKKNILPVYFARAFNLPSIKSVLRKMAKGAVNQANINSKELASILLPLPPLELQNSFASKMIEIEATKYSLSAQITAMKSMLSARMQYWLD